MVHRYNRLERVTSSEQLMTINDDVEVRRVT